MQRLQPSRNYDYLNSHKAYFAELLSTTKDNIDIYTTGSLPNSHGYSCDVAISVHGLSEETPVIHLNRMRGKISWKREGVIKYVCSSGKGYETTAEGLEYLMLYYSDSKERYQYIIARKSTMWKIIRHLSKQYKSQIELIKPILAEELSESILKNTIGFLKHYRKMKKYGIKPKRGVILTGSPGNGKTMFCRYLQNLCTLNGFTFNIISSSAIESSYKEDSLDNLFCSAQIMFFDDIDISYLNRRDGGKIACSILSAMDGMGYYDKIIRIFTTNEPINNLDEAFTRPGRIDCTFHFDKPTPILRERLIESWTEEFQVFKQELIEKTKDFSFAEIESIRNILATNYIIDGKWDVEKAFKEHRGVREDLFAKRKSVGF